VTPSSSCESPPEQLVDVDVLRPVHRRELEKNEFVVGRAPARRARSIVDQHAVGQEAAQRRLELVMVRIDEAGHDDAAGGVDVGAAACSEVRADGEDLLALHKHVRPGEVADGRVHRHHGTAANDVAPARLAGAWEWSRLLRCGGARRKQIETCGGGTGRRRAF